MRRCLLPTFMSIALLATSLRAQESHPFFAPADVFELEYAADPQIAPDGERVVYERRAFDIMTDRGRSSLWIVDADGANHRPLLADGGSYGAARWSADGSRIAYLAKVNERKQLHVRWLDTGQSAVVTNLQQDPDDLSWSPDGRLLAFTMDVPADEPTLELAVPRPEGAQWAPDVKIINSVTYRFDGRGFLPPTHKHIFVVPAEGGTPRQLTSGDFNHPGPLTWTPDSKAIVFGANRDPDWEYDRVSSDLYRVGVSGGELVQLTRGGTARFPMMSPDGQRIAFLGAENRKVPFRTTRLWVMDADGSNSRSLTDDLDRSAADPAWGDNGATLYFTYDDHGRRQLARTDLRGRRAVVTDSVGGTSLGRPYTGGDFSVSRSGVVAYTQGREDRPAEVAIATRGRTRLLTSLNEDLLQRRQLAALHELEYTSTVGDVPIQGWYLTPPDYQPGRRYPLILELHGGPHAAYGPGFSAEMQLMAAQGYLVFYDNYRGSTSYGEAFALLLQNRYSSPDEFADHMSGIDMLIEQGIADPDNLFVTGGSAGGIATLYAIGLTNRFNAAAAAKPIANWISKTLTGDIYTYQIDYQFPGPPWEAFEHYWQRSPLSLVGKVETPTLLITGEVDYRTPISETEQYYQALQLRRVPAVMVRVPEASHGIASRPSHLIAKVSSILDWFARYMKE